MRLISLFSLFSVIFFSCEDHGLTYTSKWKHKKKYEDKIGNGSYLLGAGHHYSIEKTKDDSYVYKQYYPATEQIVELSTYNDPFLKIRHGKYILWLDDGTKILEGEYKSDQKSGVWKYYDFESGKLLREQKYNNGNLERNSFDYYAKSKRKERERTAKVIYYGKIKEMPYTRHKYQVSNSFALFGALWFTIDFHSAGGWVDRGNDEGSTLVSEKDSSLLKPYLVNCISVEDPLECSSRELIHRIQSKLDYPAIAGSDGIEGVALLKIVLDKEGNLKEGEVVRGICGSIKAECQELLDDFPDYEPAKRNGVPVDYTFYLPIAFELNHPDEP